MELFSYNVFYLQTGVKINYCYLSSKFEMREGFHYYMNAGGYLSQHGAGGCVGGKNIDFCIGEGIHACIKERYQ